MHASFYGHLTQMGPWSLRTAPKGQVIKESSGWGEEKRQEEDPRVEEEEEEVATQDPKGRQLAVVRSREHRELRGPHDPSRQCERGGGSGPWSEMW